MKNGKPTVVVSKIGGVFYMPSEAGRASKVGEQGETLSVIQRLVHLGCHVVYYGSYRGMLPDGVIGIEPALGDLNEISSGAEQMQVMTLAEAHLAKEDPDLFVHVLGMEGTTCLIDNPRGCMTQASAVRYCAPPLHAVHTFKKPRVCINNDPRSYPKTQELSDEWPEITPAALLDQTDVVCPRVIGGKKWEQRSAYSGAENWWQFKRERPDVGFVRSNCIVVAHAHITTGCKQPRRDDAWQTILGSYTVPELVDMGVEVYGTGWEGFSGYDPAVFHLPIRPDVVPYRLLQSIAQPAVAPKNGFYTGKASISTFHGCMPLFYGCGEEYTYDLWQRYSSYDDWWRLREPDDLGRVLTRLRSSDDERRETVEALHARLVPDFSLFDDCIADALSARSLEAILADDGFYERYGGLRAVR